MTIIPFDDRDGYIWVNGKFIPWKDATTHILCHGLHYGSAVFEGERVYDSRIFKIKEHGERLNKSAQMLDYEIPYSSTQIDDVVKELAEKQNVTNGYVRRIAWRGSEMMAISAQNNTINVAVASWPWPNLFGNKSKDDGVRLKMADYKRPSPETAPCHAKAAGLYMICTISKHKAEREGYNDALMLDYRGYISEATGANIFFIKDGEIHTPTPDCFLDGITRRTIISLAKKQGLKVIERHIKPEELNSFSECFLTGTAAEITPIKEIEGINYEIGKISKSLISDYHDAVHSPS